MSEPRSTMTPVRGDDRGTTLMELLISMVIMTIFLGLFAAGVLGMSAAARRQSASITAQQQTREAFLQLDKQIRYAEAITTPSTVAGNQWIEWQVPDPTIPIATSASQSRCFQWKASATSGTLMYRSWIVPTTGTVSVPSWRTVASGLVITNQPVFTTSDAGLAAAPFSVPAGSSTSYGRLGIAVTANGTATAGRSASSAVFTALNSPATATVTCTEVPRS